jgi:hypothetical protein
MQRKSGGMQTFVKDRETEHLLNPVKILIKQNLPKISMASIEIGETKEGDILEVPRWVAEVLAELGFAQIQEEIFEVEMLKTLSRERIQGPNQLSTITGDFYLKLRRYLDSLKGGSYPKGASRLGYDEAHMKAMDLITLRTVKLLPLTVGDSAADLMQKVTPEEIQLFNIVRDVVQQWKQTVLEGIEDE